MLGICSLSHPFYEPIIITTLQSIVIFDALNGDDCEQELQPEEERVFRALSLELLLRLCTNHNKTQVNSTNELFFFAFYTDNAQNETHTHTHMLMQIATLNLNWISSSIRVRVLTLSVGSLAYAIQQFRTIWIIKYKHIVCWQSIQSRKDVKRTRNKKRCWIDVFISSLFTQLLRQTEKLSV